MFSIKRTIFLCLIGNIELVYWKNTTIFLECVDFWPAILLIRTPKNRNSITLLMLLYSIYSQIVDHCWLNSDFFFHSSNPFIYFLLQSSGYLQKNTKVISISLSLITHSPLLITNAYRVSNSYPFLMSRTHKSMLRWEIICF